MGKEGVIWMGFSTSYNKYIKDIKDQLGRMETSGGSLRSQGLM
jgi:hypothetical protein